MAISEEDPHCVRYDGWEVTYWMNNMDGRLIASGSKDAVRADLSIMTNSGYLQIMTFEMPRERYSLETLVRSFQRVHESGKMALRAEFRSLIGV